ncbi:helix-turn-helix domain containing protein [Lacticaseibacillus pabuli]|uniref:Helix-turn-helix domain containing protein n=1 Tax=Lacticaseibacillus pabuli TaxID=3025672 RepID=A0ABY7WPC4_9LACO|nr:TetR/AcrR family transcriptional regulator [Lacticaseibacillus sp. KACC 23028]WDF82038.1 helix-turn-helix domain containing protein [Lacticaseibacillus sp. KACC 23028]
MAQDLELLLHDNTFAGYTDKQLAIVEAAVDVFAAKGYANSSTHEIAKRAGVAEGNIFSKFGNKRGLLDAIINPVLRSIFPDMVHNLQTDEFQRHYTNLREFISVLVGRRYEFMKSNARVMKIFIAEVVYNTDLRQKVVARFPEGYWQLLFGEFDDLRQRGMLVDWDNSTVMFYLIASAAGIIGGAMLFNQEIAPHTQTQMIDAITRALSPA